MATLSSYENLYNMSLNQGDHLQMLQEKKTRMLFNSEALQTAVRGTNSIQISPILPATLTKETIPHSLLLLLEDV